MKNIVKDAIIEKSYDERTGVYELQAKVIISSVVSYSKEEYEGMAMDKLKLLLKDSIYQDLSNELREIMYLANGNNKSLLVEKIQSLMTDIDSV